jgi:hypothetical protein
LLLCCSGDLDRVCGVFLGGGGSRERFSLAKTGAAVVGSGEDSEVVFLVSQMLMGSRLEVFWFCVSESGWRRFPICGLLYCLLVR